MTGEDWYSNKDLFEMVQSLKVDLAETTKAVREYNNLRQTLNDVIRRVTCIEERSLGRHSVGKGIREWGGWVVGIIALMISLYINFGR